jgi:hypothetical protein
MSHVNFDHADLKPPSSYFPLLVGGTPGMSYQAELVFEIVMLTFVPCCHITASYFHPQSIWDYRLALPHWALSGSWITVCLRIPWTACQSWRLFTSSPKRFWFVSSVWTQNALLTSPPGNFSVGDAGTTLRNTPQKTSLFCLLDFWQKTYKKRFFLLKGKCIFSLIPENSIPETLECRFKSSTFLAGLKLFRSK